MRVFLHTMTPSLFEPNARPQPIPEPPEHKHAPTARRLAEAHRAYWSAYVKAHAVDHPYSRYTQVPEAEKSALRAERWALANDLKEKYEALLERAFKPKPPKALPKPKAVPSAMHQQRLFSDEWLPEFTEIAERFPRRPYVSQDLTFTTVRPLDQASAWKYLQHNPPAYAHLMVIDYDQDAPDSIPVSEVWRTAGLPAPAWIARTPGTTKGHIAWALATPVCTTAAGNLAPLRYLAAIEQAYNAAISGDAGYAGLLTKNPVFNGQGAWEIEWIDPTQRSLGDLAAAVDLPAPGKHTAPVAAVGFGRKVVTFDTVRHWAYSSISQYWISGEATWHLAVRKQVDLMNGTFSEPLHESHCKSIAKSIAKWVWQRFTPLTKHQLVQATHTPEVQAMRGRLKGAKRREALMAAVKEMSAAGATQRAIQDTLGVPQKTVSRWLSRFESKPISDSSGV